MRSPLLAAVTIVIFVTGTAALSQPQGAGQQRNWCGTAEKRESVYWHAHEIFDIADSTGLSYRARERISRVLFERIIPISDQRVCEQATRAYYRHHLGPLPIDGVAVVRVGDRYAVYGERHGGEWTILEIYNLAFELITSDGA